MPLVQTAFDFGPVRAGTVVNAPAPRGRAGVNAPAPRGGALAGFDPEAERVRAARMLERTLGNLLGTEVALTLTDNARSMVSARQRSGVAYVRLHHMFAHADEVTVRAVARYLTDGHQSATGQLQRFIKAHRDRIRRLQPGTALPSKLSSHHDLVEILTALNAEYFADEVQARIGWARMGRAASRRGRRRSIKLGSYRSRDALIRVHPVLDAAWVPSFFVHYIVYHEMVHHVVAMPVENGRRCLHGPEFRAREQQFARYDEAIAWEQANLDRLLSG
jgi:hypothetical protein